jgi:hypothetical protein
MKLIYKYLILKKIKEYYEDLFNEIKKFEIEISRVKVSKLEKNPKILEENPKILELLSDYEKICKKVQELEGRKIITNTNNNNNDKLKPQQNIPNLHPLNYKLPVSVYQSRQLLQKKSPIKTLKKDHSYYEVSTNKFNLKKTMKNQNNSSKPLKPLQTLKSKLAFFFRKKK